MADLLGERLVCVSGNKQRGKKGKVAPRRPMTWVRRDFTAAGPNQLWLTDLTEQRTNEGKFYRCAINDALLQKNVLIRRR